MSNNGRPAPRQVSRTSNRKPTPRLWSLDSCKATEGSPFMVRFSVNIRCTIMCIRTYYYDYYYYYYNYYDYYYHYYHHYCYYY